jgi:HTH-type transcriptional regulator/antitoxin HigA
MTIGTVSYGELLHALEPRPLTNEADYEAMVAQLNALLDKPQPTAAEEQLIALLGTLVMAYEEAHYPDEQFELHGVALVRGLMAERGLRQTDLLAIFKTKSIASAVLNGHRQLTVAHIDKLAHYFRLPHTLFF